jgi:hypothetical protein
VKGQRRRIALGNQPFTQPNHVFAQCGIRLLNTFVSRPSFPARQGGS